MNKKVKLFIYLIYLIFFISCNQKKVDDINYRLEQFFEIQWEYKLNEFPEYATYLGDKRYNSNLTDMSIQAINNRHQYNKNILKELERITYLKLNDESKLNYDLFWNQLKSDIVSFSYKSYLIPINQLGGIHIDAPNLVNVTPFTSLEDYSDYISRLRLFPKKFNQIIKLMEKGIEENILPPKVVLKSVPKQIKKQFEYEIENSPFYNPALKFPKHLSDKQCHDIKIELKNIIQDSIYQSYRKLYDFFNNKYYPKTRNTISITDVKDGFEYYNFLIRKHTTTDLSSEEIHKIGLSEVNRIRNEMNQIISELNFDGTFNQFLHFLRTDPSFYYENEEELLDGYRLICKKIDPKLVDFFGKLPRTPYGVSPIPEYQAPSAPTAYYHGPSSDGKRAGYFWANTYKLDTRPKYEMEVLTLHEAVPGHHLQIALANELQNVPNFRKHIGHTAFIEGWALYAESLGDEMGIYDNLFSKFGQLTYEMWRACRLVVDTGIHSFGWTRYEAIDYMLKNTAKTKYDIEVEIDRYITWPGQALAYKIGELKIKELRKKAEYKLGKNFNLRDFHDLILEDGSIPIESLEKKISTYIQKNRSLFN